MGGQAVHETVEDGLGIVLHNGHHRLTEPLRAAVGHEAQNGIAEGVVHHRIQFAIGEIAAAHAVSDFI